MTQITKPGKMVFYDNRYFPSIKAVAEYLNIPAYKIYHEIAVKGVNVNQAIDIILNHSTSNSHSDHLNPNAQPVTVFNHTYPSLYDALQVHGVTYNAIHKRTNPTNPTNPSTPPMSLEEAILDAQKHRDSYAESTARLRNITVDNQLFPNLSAVARTYDILLTTLVRRMQRNNLTVEQAVHFDEHSKPPALAQPITVNNIAYSSMSDAARAHNISVSTVKGRLRHGYSIDDAFTIPVSTVYAGTPKQVTVNNVIYPSVTEAAKAHGIKLSTIRQRQAHGMSTEDAILKPVRPIKRHNDSK